MKRTGPIARRTELRRSKPVNARNQERREREHARAYGGEHADWIRSQPCAVGNDGCEGRVEAAHTESGGAGRKADARTLAPLCWKHHRESHTTGVQTFERTHSIDLRAVATALWQRSPYREEA